MVPDADTPPDDADAHLRARLRTLAETWTQSEIARRTGTPLYNISRYLKGTKIPAEFCVALVRTMDVNPVWLLAGEGAPNLSRISSDSARIGEGLIELVQALSTVERMKLGALLRPGHGDVLKRLSDSVSEYERLRENLNTHTRPVFKRIIGELRQAARERDAERGGMLLRAGEQVSRLCLDPALARDFASAKAHFEHSTGSSARALIYHREVFASHLPEGGVLDERSCIEAHNFVLALIHNGMYREARRVTRATIELTRDHGVRWVSYNGLMLLSVTLDVELGLLRPALTRTSRAVPSLPESYRRELDGARATVRFLAGLTTFGEAVALGGETLNAATQLTRLACWLEQPGAIRQVCRSFIGDRKAQIPRAMISAWRALALRDALTGAPDAALDALREHAMPAIEGSAPRLDSVTIAVTHGQILRLAGRADDAVEACLTAQRMIDGLPDGVIPELLIRATHSRNVLHLLAAPGRKEHERSMRNEAGRFFRLLARRGYACFRGLPPVAEHHNVLEATP